MRKNDAGFTGEGFITFSDPCSIAHTKSKSLRKGMTKRKFLKSLHVKLAKVRYSSV